MKFNSITKRVARLRDGMIRALKNRDGIAAVEFGYIAPVMLLMLVGSVEASRAISIDRRFSSITSMVGDLVSREQSMGDSQGEHLAKVEAIMAAIEHVMEPHPHDTLQLEIIPVKAFGSNGTDTKLYADSYKYSGGTVSVGRAKCSAYALPPGLVGQFQNVIVVEAKYTYKPLEFATWMYGGSYEWEDKSTHSPRHQCVNYGDNCLPNC